MVKGVEELIGSQLPFYEVDICDEKALDAVFEKGDIESSAVLHFAALKAVGESVEKPDLYHKITSVVLRFCSR